MSNENTDEIIEEDVSNDILLENEDDDDNNDDNEEQNIDDDPLAEGEEPLPPWPEPSDKKASSIKFFTICRSLEYVAVIGTKQKWKDEQKLCKILPPKSIEWLNTPSEGSDRPESIFPILRLLAPERDGSRQFSVAEKKVAIMYAGALELAKDTSKYQMLTKYTDPVYVSQNQGLSDLSQVVYHVLGLTKLQQKDSGSDLTIGDINKELDEFAKLPAKLRSIKSNHDWKNSSKKKKPSLDVSRINWLKQLNRDSPERKGLSPLEHKWLVRILLRRMQFGLGFRKLLGWCNPRAPNMWDAHNSLKGICDKLCYPEFTTPRDQSQRANARNEGLDSYTLKSVVAPEFGAIFTPMLSNRTGFDRVLNDISHRHREYIQSIGESHTTATSPSKSSLAFKHPAFSVEPKLDGERFIAHISRDGVVKLHTRRGTWYSELYSPVLGPPLRRSLRKNFDVILDGEIIAWDSQRKETIPFGNNRTIASFRKKWLETHGLLDPRDFGMHKNESGNKSMDTSNTWNNKKDDDSALAGEECWLQYVVFDIVYVNGPGADDFLSKIVSDYYRPTTKAGSIIDLDAIERKKVLYAIIEPQENEVEIIKTWVIRPNGRTELGEEYFIPGKLPLECGYPPCVLDSLGMNSIGLVENMDDLDAKRRRGRSDEQIAEARARSLQALYDVIVEEQRLEGLVFKDLSTPYCVGEESRNLKYWLKFKPDYFNGSVASDLDMVVIGGYFATGLRKSGRPSSLLCACVDSKDHEMFYPVVKVNAGSMDTNMYTNLLRITGYNKEDDAVADKWFRLDKDKKEKEFPPFVSLRSPHSNEEIKWRVQKKDYPDIWIDPSNSVVLTLNAGEIVESDAFPLGLTLRFPRVTKLRTDADAKEPSDCESEVQLWRIYQEVQESRSGSSAFTVDLKLGSPSKSTSNARKSRFLSEEQFAMAKKRKKSSKSSKYLKSVHVPSLPKEESVALKGVSVAILGQKFRLKDGSIDFEEAQSQGWLDIGRTVKDANSVIQFVRSHGALYQLSASDDCTLVLGSTPDDPKVGTFIKAIENAQRKVAGKTSDTTRAIARSPGVVRWTFIFSAVHKWLSEERNRKKSILQSCPAMLQPCVLDYLAQPDRDETSQCVDKSLLEIDLSRPSDMRRALSLISESGKRRNGSLEEYKQATYDWKLECSSRLKQDERWIAFCKMQCLWPYRRDQPAKAGVVVYPDVFTDFGSHTAIQAPNQETPILEDERTTSSIVSVIPLLKAMGATISSHLHVKVTHILCEMNTAEAILFSDISADSFSDKTRGQRLLDRMNCLKRDQFFTSGLSFVSPRWVRKRKWESSV